MTKRRLKGYLKSYGNHIDPENEEQLRWIKIGKYSTPERLQSLQYNWRLWNHEIPIELKRMQSKDPPPPHLPHHYYPERGILCYTERLWARKTENKVRRILKLIKSINQGNKDGNLKKKSELIQLTEDFHKQYESLYALYDDLRGEIRRRAHVLDGDESPSPSSSSSSSDSELFYTPKVLHRTGESSSNYQKVTLWNHQKKPDIEDTEDAVLKDKLTCTSEVKQIVTFSPSPLYFSEVPESESDSGEVIKDVRVEPDQSEIMRQKLVLESAWLKDKLMEKEEELLSLAKKHQLYEHERFLQINKLEGQVSNLKLEHQLLNIKFAEQVECGSSEAKELKEEISRLEDEILELEAISQKKDDQICAFQKKYEEIELNAQSRIEGVIAKANVLQLEVESLRVEKADLENQLCRKDQERAAEVKGLTEEFDKLQQKVESLSKEKDELESELDKQSRELSGSLIQIDGFKEKLSRFEKKAMEENERFKLLVRDMEDQITNMTREANHSKIKKEELHGEISLLETTLIETENELFTIKKEYETHKNETSCQIISYQAQISYLQEVMQTLQGEKGQLELELEREKRESSQNLSRLELEIEREKRESSRSLTQMEKNNFELTNKIADQNRIVKDLEGVINKLSEENKQVRKEFHAGERKIEEMVDEVRKQFEDSLVILSRRIRVAEQLQVENTEWYRNNRTVHERENKDLKEKLEKYEVGMKNVKEMSLTANQILGSLDKVALKFEEFTANFPNRISKASCELNFVKDWVVRKNKAITHVKEDLDCLLAQLDEKESEILIFREKVWKSENKVRDLEKMIKEKDDSIISIQEEKREAIRQLCVWIDYHRSRSDYYKKTLTDITTVGSARRAT